MFDFGKIQFIQSHEDGQKIVHEIRGDSSLDEVVEAFEMFLKGAGYHLSDGQHIGYEYDDESDSSKYEKSEYYFAADVFPSHRSR